VEGLGWRFALHSWTLGVGRIAETIATASAAGYDAIELSWQDFEAAAEPPQVGDVRQSLDQTGLAVAAIGIKAGWLFSNRDDATDRLAAFVDGCQIARALDCPLVISAVGAIDGEYPTASTNLRAAIGIAADHGLLLALEPNLQHPRLNTPQPLMRLIEMAGGGCGIVLDSYHLHRASVPGSFLAEIPASLIALVHASDVSATPAIPPEPLTDRLLPGEGEVDWPSFFKPLRARGYRGLVSLEAPNPNHWAADPGLVARRGFEALRELSSYEQGRP
jgi:sugar phosphate isomerase/epimerase